MSGSPDRGRARDERTDDWVEEHVEEGLEAIAGRALRPLARFVESSRASQGPVYRDSTVARITDDLALDAWIERGGLREDALEAFLASYLTWCTRLHHPGFLAHQIAVPRAESAVADLVSGMLNNGAAVYEMGPSAIAVEQSILGWMLGTARFRVDGSGGSGVLTHGGTLANLTCLLGARMAAAPEAWTSGVPRDLVVLASPAGHYSIARALSILGLGSDALIELPCDALGVVDGSRVGAAIDAVRESGRTVMAVVANACATATGLHDPLDAMGRACRERGVWLHVDGAHGASALLSQRHRHLLAGVELADSLSWDAHKMLGVSALCAAALFRDPRGAGRAFQQHADYFADIEGGQINPFDSTLECTRSGLGLRLFLTLGALGERGLGEHVAGLYDAARLAHEVLSRESDFACPYEPQSNILCFEYRPSETRSPDGAGDAAVDVEALRRELSRRGDFLLSSATVDGRRCLRLVVMNPLTDRHVLERLVDAVRSCHGGAQG